VENYFWIKTSKSWQCMCTVLGRQYYAAARVATGNAHCRSWYSLLQVKVMSVLQGAEQYVQQLTQRLSGMLLLLLLLLLPRRRRRQLFLLLYHCTIQGPNQPRHKNSNGILILLQIWQTTSLQAAAALTQPPHDSGLVAGH
jgi:CDP-diacylglycerol pyrophosphatase